MVPFDDLEQVAARSVFHHDENRLAFDKRFSVPVGRVERSRHSRRTGPRVRWGAERERGKGGGKRQKTGNREVMQDATDLMICRCLSWNKCSASVSAPVTSLEFLGRISFITSTSSVFLFLTSQAFGSAKVMRQKPKVEPRKLMQHYRYSHVELSSRPQTQSPTTATRPPVAVPRPPHIPILFVSTSNYVAPYF